MRSIHGVGELMTQVVLRGGGFLPMTPLAAAPEGNVKQSEPEKEDILVMDTKLKIIEILQVLATQISVASRAVFNLSINIVPCCLLILSCLVCAFFKLVKRYKGDFQACSTQLACDNIMPLLKQFNKNEFAIDICIFTSDL